MKLKRTVSVILAFLMIMGMIPLSVLAAGEDYEQIRFGETKSANILNAGKQAIFKFIPDEDGYYSFFSSGNDDTYGYIYDENMEQFAYDDDGGNGSNFKVSYEMTAGTVYLLAAKYYSNDRTGLFDVSIFKETLATEISIASSLKGYIGTSDYLNVSATLENSFYGKIEWSSSNEDIATVDQSGRVTYKAAGTATITAKSKTDLIATCEVTVSEPGTLYENTPRSVEINESNEEKAFYFTPSESGKYTFYCDNYSHNQYNEDDGYAGITIYGANYNFIASDRCCITYALTADVKYMILTNYARFVETQGGNYDLTAVKAAPPTSIQLLDESKIEMYPNTTNTVSIKFDPWYADYEKLTWTSGNESILSVNDSYPCIGESVDYTCRFITKAVGTTTLTATAENKVTAQYTITVKDYESISAGETKTVVVGFDNRQSYYKFTPEETGYYSFYSNDKVFAAGSILDENLNELASDNFWSSNPGFKVKYKMTAGTKYILRAGYNSSGITVRQFDVTVEKAKYITKLEVIDLPNKLDYAKGYIGSLDYSGLAVKATWSDGTTTIGEYRSYELCFEDEIADIDSSSTEETGIVKISCNEAETEFKVNLIDDLVLKMEVVKTHRYIENSNGYYSTDYNTGGHYFHYNTYDTIKVYFKDGTTGTLSPYTYLNGYYPSYKDDQDKNHWTVGSVNYYTVTYLGHSISVSVTIEPSPVESISVISGTSKRYIENAYGYNDSKYISETEGYDHFYKYRFEKSDIYDAVIQINYTNGKSKTARLGDKVDGYYFDIEEDQYTDHWKLGSDNYVTVSYMGKETKLPITVIANQVDHIEVISAPSRIYYYGDEAFGDYDSGDDYYYFNTTDPTGLTIKVYYKNGNSKQFTLKNSDEYGELDGYDYEVSRTWGTGNGRTPDFIGSYRVEFNYIGCSAYYDVTLKESPVESISVTKKPSKTVYNSAFAPIFDGMEIKVKYKNDRSETVTLTAENTSRSFTFVDQSIRYDYIYVNGDVIIIKQENYYGIGNEFSVSYLGAETEIENIFSYEYDRIEDVTVTKFNRYTLELSLTVKYKSGKTEALNIKGIQINGDERSFAMCYAVTPNGILYFDIDTDSNYRVDACDIDILGKTVHIPAKQNIYDIDGDGKADAQDLVLLRTALLNSADAEEYPELDINGDGVINILDLIRLKKYISGLIKVGDVNADGKIDAQDLVLLRIALMNSATADQNYALDNNGDGIVNILDLICLKKHIANGASLGGSGKTASST